MKPLLTAAQAADLIHNDWTVISAGFVGAGHAEAITRALEARFLATGLPRDLTLIYGAGQGDRANRGVNHFGHAGLVKRVIGGHWISAPKLGALVNADAIEAWNLPQGVISHLFRAIAGGKSGVVTRIGLHTFVDPRHDGARLTPRTAASALEPRVELVTLGGEEQLFYPGLKIDCALIRATTADERGNLTTEDEPFHQDLLAVAQAAHNSGGIVIAQVKRVVANGTLDPNLVRVPGILIDHLVVCEDPADHWMTFGEEYNPAYTQRAALALGAVANRVATHEDLAPAPAVALSPVTATVAPELLANAPDARRIVQRRAFLELLANPGAVVNLGVGMPAGIGQVAADAGVSDFTLTLEAGPIGGTPASFLSFGASAYPQAIIDQAAMFDFYDGGGLDLAFLGLAEFDPQGNVNVSRFGAPPNTRIAGLGGFMNITQTAKRLVFMGTLTAGGLVAEGRNGRLHIEQEGRQKKLLPRVSHLSFNGPYVAGLGRSVRFITERAVFEMRDGRLTLIEIAPGIDLDRDVLAQCGAPVAVADGVRLMDAWVFGGEARLPPDHGRSISGLT